jgi:hypothetical protein
MSRTLTVYLAADLKKFSGPLRTAETQAKGFGGHIGRLGTTLSGMLGPALIGAGIAAGAMAVKLGVDGVKAAIEDEAAVAKLAQTMTNLGLAHDTAQVEASIASMETELGIVDMELRPAYDRLVRSIGDTDDAMKAMSLAADISAGTGKSLDAVVQALGRAYDGNTQGLSRLGAGLSATLLKTGDMKAITEQLATTFGGQATTQAQTFEGQIKRLSLEFDNLKESLGRGFITGLGDANDSTDELMATLKELEPAIENIGKGLGDFALSAVQGTSDTFDFMKQLDKIADYVNGSGSLAIFRLADQFNLISDEAGAAAEAEYQLYLANHGLIGQMDPLARGLYAAELRWRGYADATLAARAASSNFALTIGELRKVISPTVAAAIAAGKTTATYGGTLTELGVKVDAAAGSTGGLTKETGLLTTAFDLQRGVIDKLQGTLDTQVGDLERATAAARDYSTTLASQLLGGIDLGAAQQTGADLGMSTLDAFDRQIEEAKWFGNVLSSIKASGADQRLIDQLASLGPAAGGALAQEMIDKGLVQTFSDRLVDVIDTANTTAQAMVPEFLVAGVASAEQFVDGTIEQLLKEQDRLKTIGKTIGKAIGKNIKAEIAQAVAEAVAAAQAAKTAASAERASQIAAQQVVVSEQQIAQALQRLISNSNARSGYSMGIPVPTPVLG